MSVPTVGQVVEVRTTGGYFLRTPVVAVRAGDYGAVEVQIEFEGAAGTVREWIEARHWRHVRDDPPGICGRPEVPGVGDPPPAHNRREEWACDLPPGHAGACRYGYRRTDA